MSKIFSLAMIFAALPAAALAQQARDPFAPTTFNGDVIRYSEDSITLKDKDGKEISVALEPKWFVSRPAKGSSAALKRGDFIASQNKPVDDKTGESTELRIFEPGYRPENGSHGMGPSGNIMTHGTVDKVAKTAKGVELDITYPDGGRHLILPGDMPITYYVVLDRSVLKPGTKVGAVARKGADGVLRAGRLTVN